MEPNTWSMHIKKDVGFPLKSKSPKVFYPKPCACKNGDRSCEQPIGQIENINSVNIYWATAICQRGRAVLDLFFMTQLWYLSVKKAEDQEGQ